MTAIDFDFADSRTDYRVSIIREARDTETHEIGFRDALSGIRTGRWAAKVNAVRAAYAHGGKDEAAKPKKLLPGILFSGTFSRRSSEALIAHSGLICADLDGLGEAVETWFEQITADPHTLACFRSPTGSGLKVVFRIDPSRPHIESFHAAEHYMLEHFGLAIDEKCSDVSRICFVSHDPELFEADNSDPLPYPPPKTEAPAPQKPAYTNGTHLSPGDDFITRGGVKVPDLLLNHGWTHLRGKYWCRPGKTGDVSASWEHYPNTFHVFSSAPETGLPTDQKGFDPFALFTHLEHGGDWKAATKALAAMGYGEQPKPRQQQNLDRVAGPEEEEASTPEAKPLFSFDLVLDGDKSVLLGNRYLNRGDGAVLVSTSGMGKSTAAVQGAAELALGKGPFGIQGNGPLSSLIVQSEDSEGDIAEVAYSLKHVLKLTPDQIALVNSRVHIHTDRVNRGLRFIKSLKKLIEKYKPDLVWINPLQAFMDGDVTDSKDLGAFLREGLNSLNQPPTFGYIVVHHTTKPATGKERAERLWHEVMYDMAGGAEIINWARAIISLRATANEGEFNMVLAKRGRRAGVTKQVPQGTGFRLEPVTVIPLKHATGRIEIPGIKNGLPLVYWEPRAEDAPPEPKKGTSGGRTVKYDFSDYANLFPVKSGPGMPLNELHRALASNGEIAKKNLHQVCKRWEEEGCIEIIDVHGQPRRYRKLL